MISHRCCNISFISLFFPSFLKLFNNNGRDSEEIWFLFSTLLARDGRFAIFVLMAEEWVKIIFEILTRQSLNIFHSICIVIFVFAIYVFFFFKLSKTARHRIILLENVIPSFFRSPIILLKSKAC